MLKGHTANKNKLGLLLVLSLNSSDTHLSHVVSCPRHCGSLKFAFAKFDFNKSQATLVVGNESEMGDEQYPIIVLQEICGRRKREEANTCTVTSYVILFKFMMSRSLKLSSNQYISLAISCAARCQNDRCIHKLSRGNDAR